MFYLPPYLSRKIRSSSVPWDSPLCSAALGSDLLAEGSVEHYLGHTFRAAVCVLTIYVLFPCPLTLPPQGRNPSCPRLLLMATFAPGSRLAPGMLGDRRAILGAIFLGITKTCFQMFAGTIMCYGQTGAGKTYTMTGTTENYKHRGILPRALQQVESGPTGRVPHGSPFYHTCC